MKRLLLVLPLLLHLSGLAGAAAGVCAAAGSTAVNCCCHDVPASAPSASRIDAAPPACPCSIKSHPAGPVAPVSTSVSLSADHAAPLAACAPIFGCVAPEPRGASNAVAPGRIDNAPPYLTAAPSRC